MRASFVERPNRYILVCDLEGERLKAYLPNPGRILELLLPGTDVWLEKAAARAAPPSAGRAAAKRTTAWTAVAVEREGRPVVLDTHRMNAVAAHLIAEKRVPGLEGATVAAREVRRGRSRFDFLLREDGGEILLEVKSCTLFSRRVAMFPDAVTARGRRHVEELAALSSRGDAGRNRPRTAGAVLFLVNSLDPECFLPDFHTDLAFAGTLLKASRKIGVLPLSIGWKDDLTLLRETRLLPVLWDVVEREARDSGSYMVILRVPVPKAVAVGRLGEVTFRPGFYTYVGSAARSLSSRLARHKRLRKKKHWHIDYLRAVSEWHAALPILSSKRLECRLASAVRRFAGDFVSGFGSSDCSCPSHLFYTLEDPLKSRRFHALLQEFRMERLLSC